MGLVILMKVFVGGVDNVCGVIGVGILLLGEILCSIGILGVVFFYEEWSDRDFGGKVYYFNYGKENVFYMMGVILFVGYSLSWFKENFVENDMFEELLVDLKNVLIGLNGFLFIFYLVGECILYVDVMICGSFIGMDVFYKKRDFMWVVIEGIMFLLNELIEIFWENGKEIMFIVLIGGGVKNDYWF